MKYNVGWLVLVLAQLPALWLGCARAEDEPMPVAVHGELEPAEFPAQRADYARQLAAPPLHCIAQRDTKHTLFHGCIDWHSAVHGMWSLVAATRLTGDEQYLRAVQAALTPAGIAAERAYLARHERFEMPYGRAWFLRLAVDFKRATGDLRLAPVAQDVAQSLLQRFRNAPADPQSAAYDSDTWALLNLHYYASATDNVAMQQTIANIVRDRYRQTDAACPAQAAEAVAQEFMPVCGNWAWLVGLHMPSAPFRTWVHTFLPVDSPLLQPITAPGTAHAHGIDFARAWSFWFIWSHTRETRFRDAYLAHIDVAMRNRDWWAGDYGSVAHWVAQFGMLALVVSCEGEEVAC